MKTYKIEKHDRWTGKVSSYGSRCTYEEFLKYTKGWKKSELTKKPDHFMMERENSRYHIWVTVRG